jgi:VanZ family protein
MHVPLPAPPPVPAGSDKGLHFALYLILTLLGGRYQLGKDAGTRAGVFILWAVIFTAYAAIDEWLQLFVGRTAGLNDWVADMAGVAVGTAVLILARR